MSEKKEMPEWIKEKRDKFILNCDDKKITLINDSIVFGFDQCFEILAPQIKVMKETLDYITKHSGYAYDEEEDNFELNLSNLQLTIFVAKKALKEIEAMK